MMKKLVVLLACFGLAVQLSGCSLFSSEKKSDTEVAADVDSADLEKLESADASQPAAANAALASDQLPEDALGETTPKADASAVATTPEAAPPEASKDALPADPFAENAAAPPPETSAPPVSTTPDSNTTIVDSGTPPAAMTESSSTPAEAPVQKVAPSLQKVATAPWQVGKAWFNTVYFARPGDSLASISQMIYGADKTAELKKGNATFKSRSVKPGDKVYYNSPHRPDDSSKMITFYEDSGIAPEVYVTKDGDNIRKVSKKLLGYSNAWKEVWATNTVESKDAVPAGTELHFWKGNPLAAAPATQASTQPEAQMSPPAQEMPAAHNEMAPPAPPQQQAQGDIPPPPPMPEQPPQPDMQAPPPPPPDMAQNQMAPPPPPPPVEAVNPAPPKKHHLEETPAGGMDNDTTLALAVVGLAAAALAGLIVMRKKRKQRESDQHMMDNTHVGT